VPHEFVFGAQPVFDVVAVLPASDSVTDFLKAPEHLISSWF
jgi:hypothetical protein